jgi:hypothetical protein
MKKKIVTPGKKKKQKNNTNFAEQTGSGAVTVVWSFLTSESRQNL